MGDPRTLKRKYETPKKLWDKVRIEEEKALVKEYGLKNYRELWVMEKEIKKVRREARRLLSKGDAGKDKANELLSKATRIGIVKEGTLLEDLLALTTKDILERRLQTRVFRKGLSHTINQGRQLITHGFISINGKKVSSPSYIVPMKEENLIGYHKAIDLEVKEVKGA